MVGSLEVINNGYAARYGESVRSASRLRELYDGYIRRRESTLLDSVAATVAIDALFFADQVDLNAVTPQMREAFARAFPARDLVEQLGGWRHLEPVQVRGYLSDWKGVYHELLIRDRLEDGYQVGSIVLGEGQMAVLPEELNQRGFDIRILNFDGSEDSVLQAKAVAQIGHVNDALRKCPDIQIAATDEVAEGIVDERVFPSGFSNEDLEDRVMKSMDEVWDGPFEEFVESVLPGLPFVIIATTEGTKVLMGRQSFQGALDRAVQRGVKTGAAMGAGALMALVGAGVFSLPAAFLTRLGIDRTRLHTRLTKKIENDRAQLVSMIRGAAT